ncbi:MAG: SagB/ThcOx family dehydrogenase [Nitrosotalea sp.]
MKNYETEAAWQYHDGTKHPNGMLLNRAHTYHPANRPIPYKTYKGVIPIKLSLGKQSSTISALDAISINTKSEYTNPIPDINALSSILFFSGGITKTLKFPSLGEMEFRAASCTGALYHIEIYIVCSDISGLEAGVYHFNPQNLSLTTLRKGDYRKNLASATASEPFTSAAPIMLIFTDIFSRNAVKYQAREYRHAFWDCGTILSNALAMSNAQRVPCKLVLGFADSEINSLLGLDVKKEAALAILSLGHSDQELPISPPLSEISKAEPLENDMNLFAINEIHESSSLIGRQEVSSWRIHTIQNVRQSVKPIESVKSAFAEESLETVILRRGSTRKFSHDFISLEQLSTILKISACGIVSDFEEESINDIYLIANAVGGLEQGSYFYNKERRSLELLQKGDFRDTSGHLGLDQSLPRDASVTIFFMVNLQKILECFGNRGYRVAQLDASIMGGRMYLASYALHIGATGLTFYDDEVTEFFSPHANNKSTMFMIAIGKKAKP